MVVLKMISFIDFVISLFFSICIKPALMCSLVSYLLYDDIIIIILVVMIVFFEFLSAEYQVTDCYRELKAKVLAHLSHSRLCLQVAYNN